MNRRLFLAASAAAVALPAYGAEEIRHGLDAFYEDWLGRSPEGLTELGLDVDHRAAARGRLDDRSRAADRDLVEMMDVHVRRLKAMRPSADDGDAEVLRRVVVAVLEPAIAGARRFPFGTRGDPAPFALTQLSGVQPYIVAPGQAAYAAVPAFLAGRQPLATADDAQAYVDRIAALPRAIEQETDRLREDAETYGVIPPAHVLQRTLGELRAFLAAPGSEQPFVRRLLAHRLGGPREAAALAGLEQVKAAAQRQADTLGGLAARASDVAGVWRLRDGDAYYALALRVNTASDLTAEEAHRVGLEHVAQITARVDGLLKAQGYSQGAVGARLAALAAEPRFAFPDGPAGRAEILRVFREATAEMTRRLPRLFGRLPPSALRIEAAPAAMQATGSRGYYERGSADGARPGAFYANLSDTREWSRFYLPTFAFHEGVPGHHLQYALALQGGEAPPIMRLLQLQGFSEGWAVYAEQLADEAGLYERDPFGRIGYLQSQLLRAARVVADTGLHARRWSRAQAVEYLRAVVGETASRCEAEVNRYVAWPGQACSYKLGHAAWLTIRAEAAARLGPAFDLRRFHDEALRRGAMPLDLLAELMRGWRPAA